MAESKVYIVIPARYGSTRFEGKPLASILGKPMIQHVFERASMVRGVESVLVATDDDRIRECVDGFGGIVVMTRADHLSGSDRIFEVMEKIGARDHDIVVNIQGDQPAFPPDLAEKVIEPFLSDESLVMSTPAVPLDKDQADDPNIVKVVFDHDWSALYFSRAPIPWPREGNPEYWRHLGIYAYRVGFLRTYVSLPEGRLEKLECLEQLRVLEHGYKIKIVPADSVSPDVDVPGDIVKVEAFLKQQV